MKINLFTTLVFSFIVLTSLAWTLNSCVNVNKFAENTVSDFSFRDKKMGLTHSEYNVSVFNYEYSGNITNNTQNTYKQAILKIELEVNLENGQILTDLDMGRVMGDYEFIDFFKPGEIYNVKNIQVGTLENEYLKYLVKSATAIFKVELTDDINNSSEEIITRKLDITDYWKNAANGNLQKDFGEVETDSTNAALERKHY